MTKPGLVSGALLVTVLIVAGAVMGCNPPTQELLRAEREIEQARKAGADEFALSELHSAELSLGQGKDLMSLLRYRKAKAEFERAYQAAKLAKEKALAATSGRDYTDVKTPSRIAGGLPTSHTVYPGECLWRISEYSDIYNDPFQWPLIYDANRENIDARAKKSGLPAMANDGYAHWIFPGQELGIPRDSSQDQIQDARHRAGAPEPYLPADK